MLDGVRPSQFGYHAAATRSEVPLPLVVPLPELDVDVDVGPAAVADDEEESLQNGAARAEGRRRKSGVSGRSMMGREKECKEGQNEERISDIYIAAHEAAVRREQWKRVLLVVVRGSADMQDNNGIVLKLRTVCLMFETGGMEVVTKDHSDRYAAIWSGILKTQGMLI